MANLLFLIVATSAALPMFTNGLSIPVKDKLVLEPHSVIVTETTEYIPLGWPFELRCVAAERFDEMNVKLANLMEWRIMSDEAGRGALIPKGSVNSSNFAESGFTLYIKKATAQLNNSIAECFISRPGNATLISRFHIKLQDCQSKTVYNNPCVYGQCVLDIHQDHIYCGCFRFHTGRYCDQLKDGSISYYLSPLIAFLVFVIAATITRNAFLSSKRKVERPMLISRNVGFPDRYNITFESLYYFQRRIRACRYDSDEENDAERLANQKQREEEAKAAELDAEKEKEAEPQEEDDEKTKGFQDASGRRRRSKKNKKGKKKKRDRRESREEASDAESAVQNDNQTAIKNSMDDLTTQTFSDRGPRVHT